MHCTFAFDVFFDVPWSVTHSPSDECWPLVKLARTLNCSSIRTIVLLSLSSPAPSFFWITKLIRSSLDIQLHKRRQKYGSRVISSNFQFNTNRSVHLRGVHALCKLQDTTLSQWIDHQRPSSTSICDSPHRFCASKVMASRNSTSDTF